MSPPYVYSGDGYRHTSILYSGDNDNSGTYRDKNLQLIRDIIWGKYTI